MQQQWKLPDRSILVETQKIALGPAADKGHPAEYVIFCHIYSQLLTYCLELFQRSSDLFHSPNPAAATHVAPQAINEQLTRVKPGDTLPLHNQPSKALKPRSSWETERDDVGRSKSTLTPDPLTSPQSSVLLQSSISHRMSTAHWMVTS